MTVDEALTAIRDVIQEDIGGRGLRTDPDDNLITACPGDFAAACRSIAERSQAHLVIVTGFTIPTAEPPQAETDGPLGALFLARALVPLGYSFSLAADSTCVPALRAGVDAEDWLWGTSVKQLPGSERDWYTSNENWSDPASWGPNLVVVALERVGPGQDDRCRTMRGRDITDVTSPAHTLFERLHARNQKERPVTIGIGDGGNEIGMGKLPWDTIRRNIPNGGLIACRVPTDHLIVAGVSNWGAYGLAAGVSLLLGKPLNPELFDLDRERELLQVMVDEGPLVDGVTTQRIAQVDGLTFERYAEPLRRIGEIVAAFA
jgi:hypothetical protein